MAKKYRVGVDLSSASRVGDSPGTATHVFEQVSALMKIDVPWEWAPVAQRADNPLVDICARWNPSIVPGRSVSRWTTIALGREWYRRGCDLGFATATYVPWFGLPVVVNIFDAGMYTKEYQQTWNSSGQGWNLRLIKTLGTYAVWKSKRIFMDSNYWKKILLSHFPTLAQKAVVVPCGVRAPLPLINKKPDWIDHSIKEYFLYVGGFSDNKNQSALLKVWKRLQLAHNPCPALVLVGPCREDYKKQRIDPLLKELPRSAEVILPGVISDQDLAWAYQHALGYIQPSFMEGFGMPIIEAMSYGIPVACSDTTSLPETAGNAGFLFSPYEVESVYDAVVALWKDNALRERLCVEGRRRSEMFTWKKHAHTIAAEIKTILSTL